MNLLGSYVLWVKAKTMTDPACVRKLVQCMRSQREEYTVLVIVYPDGLKGVMVDACVEAGVEAGAHVLSKKQFSNVRKLKKALASRRDDQTTQAS